jgi:sn-glycerol 3-phosphate transport system substrate-binding protein
MAAWAVICIGRSDVKRRAFLKGAAAVAGAATIGRPAIAQGTTEVAFYYPVAVGGPITKLIDKMAADFQKDNPIRKRWSS